MKRLHTFTLSREVEEKTQETVTNEKGEEVTTKKVEKRQEDRTFFLKKPYRKLFDEADLFYGVMISQGIQAGLMTRALLAKRYENDGGVLNNEAKSEYTKLYLLLFEHQNEFQRLQLEKDSEDDKEKKKNLENRIENVIVELINVREKLQDYEAMQQTVFEQTAENRARDKCILWWTLMLAYVEREDGTVFPMFGKGDFVDKLAEYDALEEKDDDEFTAAVLRKFAYYTSFWYMGKAIEEGDFRDLETFDSKTDKEREEENKIIQDIISKDVEEVIEQDNKIKEKVMEGQEAFSEEKEYEENLNEKIEKAEGAEAIKQVINEEATEQPSPESIEAPEGDEPPTEEEGEGAEQENPVEAPEGEKEGAEQENVDPKDPE